MLALIVLVWTLSNGQIQEHQYMAERQFSTIAECNHRGAEAVSAFTDRVDGVIGAGFMCTVPTNTQTPAPPGSNV